MKSSYYQEIQPTRDVSGDNFSKGTINFDWTMGSSGYFNPYKSFIKLRFKLYKRVSSADASLEKSDQIAMNAFLMENLMSQAKLNINNQCVSEVGDYLAQISSLLYRKNYSEDHMNNYMASTNFTQAYLEERQCELLADDLRTLEAYTISDEQKGDVSVATTGVITLGTSNATLAVGDTIILDDERELEILVKTNGTTFETFAMPTVITNASDGTWKIRSGRRERSELLYHNNQGCRDVRTFECIWRPSLSFFEIDEYVPCSQALFNLQLIPHPKQVMERSAIENGTGANIEPGSATDANASYVFTVESMNMYLMKGIGEPVKNKVLKLQMRETRCQSQHITTNSLHQKTFQVHPRTQELSLCYQFSGASIDNNAFSASRFVANGEDELKLRRFWVNYGNKQLPTPIPDTELNKTTKIDYFTQRYVESLMYAGHLMSPEPMRKWFQRGVYFHFSGYSAEEKEDRVFVSSQFDAFTDSSIKPNILLFDHYIKKVDVYIEDGRVQDVQVY
jgi:hypothetical protein